MDKFAIYYVKNGQLNLFTALGSNFVASIEEKKIFGEVSFFTS